MSDHSKECVRPLSNTGHCTIRSVLMCLPTRKKLLSLSIFISGFHQDWVLVLRNYMVSSGVHIETIKKSLPRSYSVISKPTLASFICKKPGQKPPLPLTRVSFCHLDIHNQTQTQILTMIARVQISQPLPLLLYPTQHYSEGVNHNSIVKYFSLDWILSVT